MSEAHNTNENEKPGLADQMFDETISGGAMFFTVVALLFIVLLITGVWGMLY